MDWLKRMNSALDYIENNLDGDIEIWEAAKLEDCSSFNFQRIFSFMANVSLADYIRKRRLSMAGMELLSTDVKVIDIAIKYGYESPTSFSRAFYAVHGLNPSEVRNPGVKIKLYPRLSFEMTIKGVEPMNYRIEEFQEFRLVGYKEMVTTEDGENFKRIPKFWNEIGLDGRYEKMMQYNDNKKLYCMGVCTNANENNFDYYIATGSNKKISKDMVELIIPKATYELVDGPQIEWYSDQDPTSDEYYSEIWLPVGKKV